MQPSLYLFADYYVPYFQAKQLPSFNSSVFPKVNFVHFLLNCQISYITNHLSIASTLVPGPMGSALLDTYLSMIAAAGGAAGGGEGGGAAGAMASALQSFGRFGAAAAASAKHHASGN